MRNTGNRTREAREEKGKKGKKATILPRQNSRVQGVFQWQKRTPARGLQGAFKWPKACPIFWTYFVSFAGQGTLNLCKSLLDRALCTLRQFARLALHGCHRLRPCPLRNRVSVSYHGKGWPGLVYAEKPVGRASMDTADGCKHIHAGAINAAFVLRILYAVYANSSRERSL